MEGYRLFMRDSLPDDRQRGYEMMTEAAWEGDAKAANNIGWLLQHGEYADQDARGAMRWYERSARQGLPVGALNWLEMLQSEPSVGIETLPDRDAIAEAAWLAGSAMAMGRGLPYDLRKGEILILKAALWGNKDARISVGQQLEMYPDSFSYLDLEKILKECNSLLPPEQRIAMEPLPDLLDPAYWRAEGER